MKQRLWSRSTRWITLLAVATMMGQSAMAAPGKQLNNPLRMQTRTTWPASVQSVGEAARYVLAPTKYRLLVSGVAPGEAAEIAARPIAPGAITSRTMAIEEALLEIAGPGTRLIVDHPHKLVSFSYMTKGG